MYVHVYINAVYTMSTVVHAMNMYIQYMYNEYIITCTYMCIQYCYIHNVLLYMYKYIHVHVQCDYQVMLFLTRHKELCEDICYFSAQQSFIRSLAEVGQTLDSTPADLDEITH